MKKSLELIPFMKESLSKAWILSLDEEKLEIYLRMRKSLDLIPG
jgi:hypothetical protein